jgi:hypothetical protein
MNITIEVDFKAVSKRLNDLRQKMGGWDRLDSDMERVAKRMASNAREKAPFRDGYLKKSITHSSNAKGINQYARSWLINLIIKEGTKPHDPTDYAMIRENGGVQYKKTKPYYAIPIGIFKDTGTRAFDVIANPGGYGFRNTFFKKISSANGAGLIFGIPRGAKKIEEYEPIFYRTRRIKQPQTPPGGYIAPAKEIAISEAIAVFEKWKIK